MGSCWSPSSIVYDRDIKRDALLQVGVREVWLVDLEGRTIFATRRGGPVDVLYRTVIPWEAVPGAGPRTIDLTPIFAGLD